MLSDEAIAIDLMSAAKLLSSDARAAAHLAEQILEAAPDHAAARWLLGRARIECGDAADALRAFETLVTAQPDSAALQVELGRAYAQLGRLDEAERSQLLAVELAPGMADAWRELALLRARRGAETEGDDAYARSLKLSRPSAALAGAQAALAGGRYAEADAAGRAVLAGRPLDPFALHLLATCSQHLRDDRRALRLLDDCLAATPGYWPARVDLVILLHQLGRDGEALPHIERLLRASPHDSFYERMKADALRGLGRHREALDLLSEAVERAPENGENWLLLGTLCQEDGDPDRAAKCFRRASENPAVRAAAYVNLADLKSSALRREDIQPLNLIALGASNRDDAARAQFALAALHGDLGEYATAFSYYKSANALWRQSLNYAASDWTTFVDRAIATFTLGYFEARHEFGIADRKPIFVVGLPRSGSTLVEQILASHSQVEGAGELPVLRNLADGLVDASVPAAFIDAVANVTAATNAALAQQYLALAEPYCHLHRARFVDKMLLNFLRIALIQQLFPQATIVDVRRHPLACGLSCFTQLFPRGLLFTYDLAEFGKYYRDYARLMAHLDAVLPGRIHRVHYEQLVTSPSAVVPALLDACGLPYEHEVERFFDNPRTVTTISAGQVRRPLYRDSLEHWRQFEPWLDPLRAELDELLEQYPSY